MVIFFLMNQKSQEGDLLEAIVCAEGSKHPFLLKDNGRVLCTRVPEEKIMERFKEIARTRSSSQVKRQKKMIYNIAQEEVAAEYFRRYAKEKNLVKDFRTKDIYAAPAEKIGQEYLYLHIPYS